MAATTRDPKPWESTDPRDTAMLVLPRSKDPLFMDEDTPQRRPSIDGRCIECRQVFPAIQMRRDPLGMPICNRCYYREYQTPDF
ncbi:MAG: hypothetical protein KGL39_56405 [Patescibacteria group bacterium]|nr:hypothetical protein [Patescibacteria group bacterium]